VKIFDRRGKEALGLQYVGVTLAWRSLIAGELRFRSIVLDRPSLVVRRDPQGRLFVAGLEMEPEERSDGVAADWLFRQGEIIIRTATVEWQDERRRAVPLRLESVDFLLQNDGRHHRFALRAQPPRELGLPIEIRGDLVGRTVPSSRAGTAGSTPRSTTWISRSGRRGSTTRSRCGAAAGRSGSGSGSPTGRSPS
jgi:uncharacterized protein involved in outer membrane biogenesis